MHRIITITATLLLAVSSMYAQQKSDNGWKERIMNEKIAFFTTEIGLTPEEAQTFWPIYNQTWEERGKAHHEVMAAYRTMNDAVKDRKGEKEIAKALDAYLAALDNLNTVSNKVAEEFKNTLPIEKVARLYLAEEKFRRNQISKLHRKD